MGWGKAELFVVTGFKFLNGTLGYNLAQTRSCSKRMELLSTNLMWPKFIKLDCPPAPLIMGFILGPMLEENLRRALLLSRGDPTVFFTRPYSLAMLLVVFLVVLSMILSRHKKTL